MAIRLSAGGVLTLVDSAVPARLRELYLALRVIDPNTEVVAGTRTLLDLPVGATAIVVPDLDEADWVNLHRPLFADRGYRIVLWCEGDAAARLARRAPDFFDWITTRVECPRSAPHFAVASVRAAICARAQGIYWHGPGLEAVLQAVHPGRQVRYANIGSYDALIDELNSSNVSWLCVTGILGERARRRLGWAIAESGRRLPVIAIRPELPDIPMLGWWSLHAQPVATSAAVKSIAAVGGSGRLAALSDLEPATIDLLISRISSGMASEKLEAVLCEAEDPGVALVRAGGRLVFGNAIEMLPPPILRADVRELRLRPRGEREDDVARTLRLHGDQWQAWTFASQSATALQDLDLALRWIDRASTLLEATAQSADKASSLPNLLVLRGNALRELGRYSDAKDALVRALATYPATTPPVQIAATRMSLAAVARDTGNTEERARQLEAAVALLRANAPSNEIALGAMLREYAVLRKDQGYLREARALAGEAVSVLEHQPGADNDRALALRHLASISLELGDLDDARANLAAALELSVKSRGTEEHLDVAAVRFELARVLLAQGTLKEARMNIDASLSIQRKIRRAEIHPNFASSLQVLAEILAAGGDFATAEDHYARAIAILRAAFGDGHPAIAHMLRGVAGIHIRRGDYFGARTLQRDALAIYERISGDGPHPWVAATLHEIAGLELKADAIEVARSAIERALSMKVSGYNSDEHPDVAASEILLAEILLHLKDHKNALKHARHAQQVLAHTFGPHDTRTISAARVESLAAAAENDERNTP